MHLTGDLYSHLTAIVDSAAQVLVSAFFTLTAYLYRIKIGEDKFSFLGFILVMMIGIGIGFLVDWAIIAFKPDLNIHGRLMLMGVSGISSYQIFDIIMRKAGSYIVRDIIKIPGSNDIIEAKDNKPNS